jgi:thiamine-phosphate pyrophosphorylase
MTMSALEDVWVRPRLHLPPLYAILDADVAASAGWTVPALARACLDGGARLLQVRAKRLGSAAFLDICAEVVEAARPLDAIVIVNDRADVAVLAGASGVHLGQEDLPVGAVQACFPRLTVVGLSTHTRAQIDAARGEAPDYVAVGPVFGTTTKATGYEAVGLDLVSYAAQASGHGGEQVGPPVVAIGGITLDRALRVIEAGAAAVAVVSDLLAGGDPARRVRDYVRVLGV